MKPNQRVVTRFTRLSDTDLSTFAARIRKNMYSPAGAALYPEPPLTEAELLAIIHAFEGAIVARANGGRLATVEKNTIRAVLLTALRELAAYVQLMCRNDLVMLLASGFDAASKNRAVEHLPKLEILSLTAGMSGRMLVAVKSHRNARSYEIRTAPVDENGTRGEWTHVVTGTNSRRITVDRLVPGRLHAFQGRSFGTAGFSDWSDVVTQRAM